MTNKRQEQPKEQGYLTSERFIDLAVQCELHAVYCAKEALASTHADFQNIDRVIMDMERAEKLRSFAQSVRGNQHVE